MRRGLTLDSTRNVYVALVSKSFCPLLLKLSRSCLCSGVPSLLMKEFLNTVVVFVGGNRTPDCTLANIDRMLSTDFKSGRFVVCRLGLLQRFAGWLTIVISRMRVTLVQCSV